MESPQFTEETVTYVEVLFTSGRTDSPMLREGDVLERGETSYILRLSTGAHCEYFFHAIAAVNTRPGIYRKLAGPLPAFVPSPVPPGTPLAPPA